MSGCSGSFRRRSDTARNRICIHKKAVPEKVPQAPSSGLFVCLLCGTAKETVQIRDAAQEFIQHQGDEDAQQTEAGAQDETVAAGEMPAAVICFSEKNHAAGNLRLHFAGSAGADFALRKARQDFFLIWFMTGILSETDLEMFHNTLKKQR